MMRDPRSKALLNNDVEALNKYKKERELIIKVNSLETEVKKLKNELTKIYEILERIEK